jgi:hypothetical protein
MEKPGTPVEEMNKRVASLTQNLSLPVYEVREIPVERRLCAGKYVFEGNGVQVELERRKTG